MQIALIDVTFIHVSKNSTGQSSLNNEFLVCLSWQKFFQFLTLHRVEKIHKILVLYPRIIQDMYKLSQLRTLATSQLRPAKYNYVDIAYSYFLNQAKIFSTLATKREGLLAILCDEPGTLTNTVSTFRSLSA